MGFEDKGDGATMLILLLVCCAVRYELSFSDPLFHSFLLTTLVLWPANLLVCFIISFGIFLLLAILDETGVLPYDWASSFLPFTPFAF